MITFIFTSGCLAYSNIVTSPSPDKQHFHHFCCIKHELDSLDSLGVQEIKWGGGGTESADKYTFLYGKGNENHELGTGFFVHKRIISAIKRVEFISDRISYIILRGRYSSECSCPNRR
jgi:hypothetical protein